ncbi:non-muscle cofilin 1-like [Polymixia lowei]
MSSGVRIADEVLTIYQKMKLHHHGDDYEEHFKILILKIDKSEIVLDDKKCLKVKDLKNERDVFRKVSSMLPPDICRYALYDCNYNTSETSKDDLILILWAPDGVSVKEKMLYASSFRELKRTFTGIKFDLQMNDPADIKDESTFLDKLGPKGTIKKLEGIDVGKRDEKGFDAGKKHKKGSGARRRRKKGSEASGSNEGEEASGSDEEGEEASGSDEEGLEAAS